MRNILLFIFLSCSFHIFSQIPPTDRGDYPEKGLDDLNPELRSTTAIYKSSDGYLFLPRGTYRCITIFINIIYDETPGNDPQRNNSSPVWVPDTQTSIYTQNHTSPYIPTYMKKLFDTVASPSHNYTSQITRLYAESSFNTLIFLSDFLVVNIKQSQISKNSTTTKTFSENALLTAVTNFINNSGGISAYFPTRTISDYDTYTSSSSKTTPDGKIDLINIILRNTTDLYGGRSGGGEIGGSNLQLKIGNTTHSSNFRSIQFVSTTDLTKYSKEVVVHELFHLFIGGNEFHTSGGHHKGSGSYCKNTFLGLQRGHGLFGTHCGMLSCNGYERWRLGWRGPTNTVAPIAANNVNADIEKFTGEKTFTLRDFVTYGDAIRIKLPYKDSSSASNQYIWLENHQCGKNGKMDKHSFSSPDACRNVVQPGIYAYYQVGKDIIEGAYSQIFISNETDNLKIISAEGNYNVTFNDSYMDCYGWLRRLTYTYGTPNAFLGVNDEVGILHYESPTNNIGDMNKYHSLMEGKIKNGVLYNDFPSQGDRFDAFVPTSQGIVINQATNPATVNTITNYNSISPTTKFMSEELAQAYRNTRKIYLTGLSIKMIDPQPASTGMKNYTVKIRWDDYDLQNDVNWCGDIVLKEKLNLNNGVTMLLEQNKTPVQLNKDAVSRLFSKTTMFTCETGSEIKMNPKSQIILTEKSAFILESGAKMDILNNAHLIVKSGSSLIVKSGATLRIFSEGRITIEAGAYICVEAGANIHLDHVFSTIFMNENALLGGNPQLFSNLSCTAAIPFTGPGSVIDGGQDVYIQNETISSNRFIGGRNIYVGKNVTSGMNQGDVIINNGAKVIFKGKTVNFEKGLEIEKGSSLDIKNQ